MKVFKIQECFPINKKGRRAISKAPGECSILMYSALLLTYANVMLPENMEINFLNDVIAFAKARVDNYSLEHSVFV